MRCSLCDRPSVLPDDYATQCSKHYLEAVKTAQADAQARFRAHIDSLFSARGQRWDWKNDRLAEEAA